VIPSLPSVCSYLSLELLKSRNVAVLRVCDLSANTYNSSTLLCEGARHRSPV
jgi:hypothetical protein